MNNTDIKNISDDDNILVTYNNGADCITKQDIFNALELSALNHGYENGLQDIEKNCSSSKFSVMLKDVGRVFKNSRALVTTNATPDSYIYNNNSISWEYDKYKLLNIIPAYVDLCYEFNKRCSIDGFLNFCGIGNVCFLRYKEKQPILSENLRQRIAETLNECDNCAQKDSARDSKQPILQLAYNNYVHGWNGEIKRKEITSTIKTLDDIKNARLEMSTPDEQNGI